MEDNIQILINLLQETGQAHHQAFIETDGADDDWAIWYADYLFGKINDKLNISLTHTQLVAILVELDQLYQANKPDTHWTRFYATELINRFNE